MSEFSSELHAKLLEYRIFETRLNDRRVDRLEVNAIAGTDLSGVIITKTGILEPDNVDLKYPPLLVQDSLITIKEIYSNPEESEDSIVKNTEYIVSRDYEFSEPVQNIKIYSPDEIKNITVLNELSRLVSTLTKNLIQLEMTDADPAEIAKNKYHLSTATGEFRRLQIEDSKFREMAFEYDEAEQQRLVKKLGSLLLY